MGRFSSVQAYADSNSAIRKVPYEQAAAAASTSGTIQANVKPEKVVNPYGSTAGAGSGEFHVYRHGRNREMQRIRRMERESYLQKVNEEFQKELDDNEQWAEERTEKRRRKREKQKAAKRRKQNLKKSGIDVGEDQQGQSCESSANVEDEFTYVPGAAMALLEEEESKPGADESVNVEDEPKPEAKPTAADFPSSIPNDGSFLELMSKQLQGSKNVGDVRAIPSSET